MEFSLSVIIPAYNEEARLGDTLRTTFAYLNEYVPTSEVIVVDDGSTDRTIAVAEESFADAGKIQPRVIAVKPNRGKGYAVRQGLLAARAPVALFSDADLLVRRSRTSQTSLSLQPKFLHLLIKLISSHSQ
jgi:dolichyl-phosphate beta-glucosyltransferase